MFHVHPLIFYPNSHKTTNTSIDILISKDKKQGAEGAKSEYTTYICKALQANVRSMVTEPLHDRRSAQRE